MAAYKVPKGEEKTIHVLLEKQLFNQASGKKESKEFVQKFDPVAWAMTKKNLIQLGFSRIEILHPTNDESVAIEVPVTKDKKPVLDDQGKQKTIKLIAYNTSLPENNKPFKKKAAKKDATNTPPAGDDLV